MFFPDVLVTCKDNKKMPYSNIILYNYEECIII